MVRAAILGVLLGVPLACADRSAADDVGGQSTTDSGESSGSGAVCEGFADDPAPPTYSISIQNGGTEALLLGGPTSCQPSYFAITSGSPEVAGSWTGPHCALTCEDSIAGVCGCTADCPLVQAVRLEPGGVYVLEWDGRVLVPAELPAACATADCGTSCNVLREVPEGVPHTLTVGTIDPAMCPPEGCACTANADGWCLVDGLFAEATARTSELTYARGEGTFVVLQ